MPRGGKCVSLECKRFLGSFLGSVFSVWFMQMQQFLFFCPSDWRIFLKKRLANYSIISFLKYIGILTNEDRSTCYIDKNSFPYRGLCFTQGFLRGDLTDPLCGQKASRQPETQRSGQGVSLKALTFNSQFSYTVAGITITRSAVCVCNPFLFDCRPWACWILKYS